jgi:hypothetical protein
VAVTVLDTEREPSETAIVLRRRFPADVLGIAQAHRATPPRTLFAFARSDLRPSLAEQVTRWTARRALVTRFPTRSTSVNFRPA